ncbi:MAG: ribulose-phosphate 3-epimerase [Candidatus Aminicenantes bacterium]|nr:ribulose-phosphate 3-epimerase [Candidatus Aminicenantes bacterium]
MKIQIAPSVLSADFLNIENSVQMVTEAGADLIHVDIMDGHFVPNLTFGPQLVSALKKKTSLPLDVHLMVDNPHAVIPLFSEAGADWLSIHPETSIHLHKDITHIKELGMKAGIALNPATPLQVMNDIIHELDYVLIMSVNPGFGGQSFIEHSREKIRRLKKYLEMQNLDIPIEIDGGVTLENMEQLIQDGVSMFVSGSGIFNQEDPQNILKKMKDLAARYEIS